MKNVYKALLKNGVYKQIIRKLSVFINVYFITYPYKRLLFLISFIPFVTEAWPQNHCFDSLSRTIERNALSNPSVTYRKIDEYVSSDSMFGNGGHEAQIIYWRVLTDYLQGKSDTVLRERMNVCIEGIQSDDFDKALLYLSLSMHNTAANHYADAFRLGLKAHEMFASLHDSYYLSKTLYVLGTICIYLKIYKMAEDYYDRALTLVDPESFDYYQILLNKSKIRFYTQPLPLATDSMASLLVRLEAYNDTGLLMVGYLNMASHLIMQDSVEKSGHYYDLALNLSHKIDNNKLKFTFYQGIGIYYFYQGETERSFDYFYRSKQIALEDKNHEELAYALYNIGYLFEAKKQIDSALFYLKRYLDINAQTIDYAGMLDVYQGYISVTLKSSEDQLTIARQEIELKNKGLAVLFIVVLATMLISGLLVAFLFQRKRQQDLIKEMDKKELEIRLENEKKLKQLQTKRHKENMEAKSREITSYSLLLSNKNQVLQQIATIIKRFPNNLNEVVEVEKIIKNNLNVDEDWQNFMLHFQKIHPKFFQSLKRIHCAQKLTENELRLCAYFRIGMSIKQIARILNVSPESVRIHRYRLKKKFLLTEEENLDDFIRNI